ASPRLRFKIEDVGLTRSGPSFSHPWAWRLAASSAQTLFTFDLLLNCNCSTTGLYSTPAASFVSASSLAFRPPLDGLDSLGSRSRSKSSLVDDFPAASFASDLVGSATWYSFGISPRGATNLSFTSQLSPKASAGPLVVSSPSTFPSSALNALVSILPMEL